ncbi:MAG TPA: TetR/AcrR family transcriptional regulator C-terminal domain-containing protein [Pseudonocardia sp.]|nr:TetR/AcrR family transcriptional regulator C-terminal domain-containing protein [Pseudonocardia sp.]
MTSGRVRAARLGREVVIERALALADAHGLDALTIRRLAVELGVTPMALYWHFSNKDELIDALAEYLFGQVVLPETRAGADWVAALRELQVAFVAALRPHPAVAPLARDRVLASRAGLVLAERSLGLLREAGFTAEQSAELGGYLLGAVVTLVTAEPGRAGPDDEAVRARRAALLTLSPREFPNIVDAAEPLSYCANDDAYYARGVELLIEGLRGLAGQDRRERV